MRKLIFPFFLLVLAYANVSAQRNTQDVNIQSIERNPIDNSPSSVVISPWADFRKEQAGELLRKYVTNDAKCKFLLANTTVTKKQTTVERYDQYYNGFKIENGSYTILYNRSGNAKFIHGNGYNFSNDLLIIPAISETHARNKAIESVHAETYAWQAEEWEKRIKEEQKDKTATHFPKGELVLIEDNTLLLPDRKLHLAYKFNVYAIRPLSREMIYVDAVTGKILHRNSLIKHTSGSGPSKYSGTINFQTSLQGSTYILHDSTRGSGIRTFTCNNTDGSDTDEVTSSSLAWASDIALDAHWGAEKVYDYWLNVQGRNSFNNSGAAIYSYVHYLLNYNNAFWTGTEMVYGDGSGIAGGGFSPLASLDVCAHEIGHAICEYTSNLAYNKESGAMNEGFSDIWGAIIEDYANPHEIDAVPKNMWKLGEEISSSSLRRMDNPNLQFQPDTYGGAYWVPVVGCTPSSGNDYCGVHYNSGVLNYWFYLLCEGGSGTNDSSHTYSVSGIGTVRGADIAYQTELVLSSTATFANCRTASINVATTLYGSCSPEVEAVTRAWYAVGVGPDYSGPSIAGIVGASKVCEASSVSMTDATSGGTWSSSSTSTATVVSTSGIVTGIAPGTVVISYSLSGGCTATKDVTVNALLPAISGTASVCVGKTTILSNTVAGGVWTSSTPGVATINDGGVVTGIAAGISIITYTVPATGCSVTRNIVVNDNPSSITGTMIICKGAGATLSSTPAGGTWTSSNSSIAYIDVFTGGVLGMGAGNATITYTLGTGCVRTATYTVNPIPDAIAGPGNVCEGAVIVLGSTSAGGVWSSGSPSIASIDASGNVAGIVAGYSLMSYTYPLTGCTATALVVVNPLPAPIAGAGNVCVGGTMLLTDADPGGTWTSGTPATATIDLVSGLVTGILAGPVSVTYTLPTSCATTTSLLVNPIPTAITGGSDVCQGNFITLNNATPGGTWSLAPLGPATISSAGVVTGLSVGFVTASYTLITGCYRTNGVTVHPAVTSIMGNNALCHSDTLLLSNATPGGTWSSSNATNATIASSGIVTPGTGTGPVTITYTTGPGCYNTFELSIFKDDGSCSPCHSTQFGLLPFNTLGVSGIIADAVLSGNYYVPNDATIYSDVVVNDAALFIEPGVTLSVRPEKTLTSNGSHWFSCPGGMWKGIVLNSDPPGPGARTARVVLQGSLPGDMSSKSTLIEDAETAVLLKDAVRPNASGSYFIQSYNTIFNHNNTGIRMVNYTPTVSVLPAAPDVYEVIVQNTVFTTRDFSGIAGYPLSWPTNYSTIAPSIKDEHIVSVPYESPYNVSTYSITPCHNGVTSSIGIELDNVGTRIGGSFKGVRIGQTDGVAPAATTWNLFDGLTYGIHATNANLKVQNNTFQYSQTTWAPGAYPSPAPLATTPTDVGIWTNMTNSQDYRLEVSPEISSGLSFPNSFYDCKIGVYSKDYKQIKCIKNGMVGRQVLAIHGYSRYGYLLQSSSYEDVKVSENSIANIANGISFVSSFGPSYPVPVGGGLYMWSMPTQTLGNLEINANTILASMSTVTPTSDYLSFGIAVQNTLPGGIGLGETVIGNVYTNNNLIQNANRGILVQGYQCQRAFTEGNYITIRPSMVAGLQKYWGINHTNNQNGVVFNNTVTGAWNGNKSPMTDSLRAYLSEYNISEQITCNYANNTGRGYEFFLDNPGMRWVKNEMDEHMKGMVLNHALIGDQGWVGYPFDNSWSSTTWGWNIGSGKYQTYVINTPVASASPLYIQTGATTNPTENDANILVCAYGPSSLNVTGSFGVIDCQSGPISDNPVKRAASYEPNVKDQVTYAEYTDARKWIGQFAAWQAVKLDTVLTDSSVVLAQFKTMASGSRFAHLSDIEDALTAGDMTTAAALIATTPAPLSPALCIDTTTGVNIKDDSTIDYIVNTHKEFYTIYLHYLQYAMDSVDSASIPVIAQLCPLEYGSVVYKARALYTNVWNDLQVWCEGCDAAQEEEQGGGQRPTIKPTTNDKQGQIYTLYPNPNDGNITLVQKIADTTAIVVDVSDVLGRSVFKEEVRFSNNSYKLNLDKIVSGMYVTSIIDAKGRMYIFKFVKQ